MSDQAKVRLLEWALRNINHVLVAVNDENSNNRFECECCGHTRYKNFERWQAQDSLSGAITRIERTIRAFKEG